MTAGLKYDNVSAYYGASKILHGISFSVEPGSVLCLLGLNGMGKTTALRAAMGLVDHIDGTITLDGKALCGPTFRRAQMGITLVPEDRKVFASLTVAENLEVSRRTSASGRNVTLKDVFEMFPRLEERMGQAAGTLSGGEQQMLVVARALLSNAKYILLDEPTEGLAPSYVEAIKKSIDAARSLGIGVVLVEQSLPLALSVADMICVLENGQIVYRCTGEEGRQDSDKLMSLLTVD